MVQDAFCSGDRLQVLLRKSKTDQAGKGVWVQLFTLPGSLVCPKRVVGEFIDMRPGVEEPFLIHGDGSQLSKFQLIAIFRKGLRAAGLEEKKNSMHRTPSVSGRPG